jgi:hypothetical protein
MISWLAAGMGKQPSKFTTQLQQVGGYRSKGSMDTIHEHLASSSVGYYFESEISSDNSTVLLVQGKASRCWCDCLIVAQLQHSHAPILFTNPTPTPALTMILT